MIISTNKGGLSNRIKSLVSCLRFGSENNMESKVYWEILNSYKTHNHLLNCPFSKLFSNNIEINSLQNIDYYNYSSHCLMVFDSDNLPDNFDTYDKKNAKYTPSDKRGRNIDFNYTKIPNLVIKKYLVYFKLLKPIKEIQNNIDEFSKKFNSNTISVHIRSWSGPNENSRNKTLFKNGVKRFENKMNEYKECTFFLATDSQDVKDYFKNKSNLKDRILCYPRKTNLKNSRENELGVQEDLVELYLLSKNKVIIGSHNSTYTEVAWWLAGCPENIFIL